MSVVAKVDVWDVRKAVRLELLVWMTVAWMAELKAVTWVISMVVKTDAYLAVRTVDSTGDVWVAS